MLTVYCVSTSLECSFHKEGELMCIHRVSQLQEDFGEAELWDDPKPEETDPG